MMKVSIIIISKNWKYKMIYLNANITEHVATFSHKWLRRAVTTNRAWVWQISTCHLVSIKLWSRRSYSNYAPQNTFQFMNIYERDDKKQEFLRNKIENFI